MTHDEIIERMKTTKKANNWTNKKIGERSDANYNTVRNLLAGENIGLYQFLDIIEGMGLEINII